jgi:hypothetical protein
MMRKTLYKLALLIHPVVDFAILAFAMFRRTGIDGVSQEK